MNATIESAHELEIKSPESHAMSSNYGHISTYNRSVFNNYIRFERDFLLCGGKTGMKVDDKRENVGYVARGLNIFDGIHHSVSAKLCSLTLSLPLVDSVCLLVGYNQTTCIDNGAI